MPPSPLLPQPSRRSSSLPPPIAVITGASRGLGLHLSYLLQAHGYVVTTMQRSPPPPPPPPLPGYAPQSPPRWLRVDLSNAAELAAATALLQDELPHVDLLVNNAATTTTPATQASRAAFDSTLQINFHSPLALTESLLPLLRRSPHAPRVVNISSGAAETLVFSATMQRALAALLALPSPRALQHRVRALQRFVLGELARRPPSEHVPDEHAYRLSKAALNAYTRHAATAVAATAQARIAFVAVCPGDVDTALADDGVPLRSPREAAQAIWPLLDVLRPCAFHGLFVRDAHPIPW